MSELKDFSASTIVVGSLNPLIFSPDWLLSAKAIGPTESAAAKENGIEVLAPNITSISFGSMKLIVEQSRFVLTVSDEPLVRAKDFPATCFRLLSHTPVVAMGLNFNATLKTNDNEKWHRFGDLLAPKCPWGDYFVDQEGTRFGGLRSLVMERAGALTGRKGHVRAMISVSEGVSGEAALQVNNHFALDAAGAPGTGLEVYKLLEECWDEAMKQSEATLRRVQEMSDGA